MLPKFFAVYFGTRGKDPYLLVVEVEVGDLEADVEQLNRSDGSFLARIMLGGLFARFGRERVRTELLRQAEAKGVIHPIGIDHRSPGTLGASRMKVILVLAADEQLAIIAPEKQTTYQLAYSSARSHTRRRDGGEIIASSLAT